LLNELNSSLPGSLSGKTPIHGRIGYLMSRYPAVSHTFFLKEVLGLRERGLSIETASINLPDRATAVMSDAERAESARTFYVKQRGHLGLMLRVLIIALKHPVVLTRGLLYAIQLGGWGLNTQAFALFYLAEAMLVGDWMRRKSLARLHVHFGGPVASVGLMTAKAWKTPLSLTLHGPDEFFDQDASYLRQKIETASFIICISDFCRSQVLRIAPLVDSSRIDVVRLGVDSTALRAKTISPTPEPSSSPVKVVCTARMVSAKGHRILLEAVAAATASGVNLAVTMIGDGPERASLEELSRQLGLASSVKFLGSLPHQATLEEVAQADFFVLASFAEGLPVALMEAMALGVPCISTPIAAIPELIQDGCNGLLVPPSSVVALKTAIERLVNSPELRGRLGAAARTTVEQQYDLAWNLDQLAQLWTAKLAIAAKSGW
jgi:glycosyltransferase involved in cell wall biosynthesis